MTRCIYHLEIIDRLGDWFFVRLAIERKDFNVSTMLSLKVPFSLVVSLAVLGLLLLKDEGEQNITNFGEQKKLIEFTCMGVWNIEGCIIVFHARGLEFDPCSGCLSIQPWTSNAVRATIPFEPGTLMLIGMFTWQCLGNRESSTNTDKTI